MIASRLEGIRTALPIKPHDYGQYSYHAKWLFCKSIFQCMDTGSFSQRFHSNYSPFSFCDTKWLDLQLSRWLRSFRRMWRDEEAHKAEKRWKLQCLGQGSDTAGPGWLMGRLKTITWSLASEVGILGKDLEDCSWDFMRVHETCGFWKDRGIKKHTVINGGAPASATRQEDCGSHFGSFVNSKKRAVFVAWLSRRLRGKHPISPGHSCEWWPSITAPIYCSEGMFFLVGIVFDVFFLFSGLASVAFVGVCFLWLYHALTNLSIYLSI